MSMISEHINKIKHDITTAANQCERDPNEILLLAVSKTKPVTDIAAAINAGQQIFGENYVQEGIEKVVYFQNNPPPLPITWHFIGHLQSNKTKDVAAHFDWVQTVDRAKIASRLNDQRPTHLAPLNVLIQVNISDESSKSGISPSEIMSLAQHIIQLPHLCLRGLMTIPRPNHDNPTQLTADLLQMQTQFKKLKAHYPQQENIDTLSMGMSEDFPLAIASGSTMIRIGSAIFGTRNPTQTKS